MFQIAALRPSRDDTRVVLFAARSTLAITVQEL